MAPHPYDPKATAPIWHSALETWLPDPAVRAFVQRFLGYGLTGDVSEQVLAFFHGPGSNGKTSMLGTIQKILGDYAIQAPSDLLLTSGRDQHPTGLTTLHGRRLVVCIEAGEGRALAEVLVKQITGGDRISARRMRENFWEFEPTHKLILAANHRPRVSGTDHAIWRRILLVPFTVVIPHQERDPHLKQKLLIEAGGILRWMVNGCLEWQREGLKPPRAVRAATEDYRQSQDAIGDFLGERCDMHETAGVTKGDLYRAYDEWARNNGEVPLTLRAFGERLKERGIRDDRRGKARTRVWIGIKLAADIADKAD